MSDKLVEFLFNSFSSINILENSKFLSIIISHNFFEFPTEIDFNVSLSAFIKCNFIGIFKIKNAFIWSPILNSRISGSSSLEKFLSQKMLIVKKEEIKSLVLHWSLRLIVNQISVEMLPSVIMILINSEFRVSKMNENT